MRLTSLLCSAAFVTAFTGCTSIPFANDIPMWNEDPDKIAQLGRGAQAAAVDKALGRTKVLWTHNAEVDGKNYQFRLYNWVERTVVGKPRGTCGSFCQSFGDMRAEMLPYAIVYEGTEPRLHSWGTLSELRDSGDPVVSGMLPRLREQYNLYRITR